MRKRLRMSKRSHVDCSEADAVFERAVRRAYAENAMAGIAKLPQGRASRELNDWVEEEGAALGLSVPGAPRRGRRAPAAPAPRLAAARPRVSGLEKRLRWIVDLLDLGKMDAAILGVIARVGLHPQTQSLCEAAAGGHNVESEASVKGLALMLGESEKAALARLDNDAPLLQLGIVEDRNGGDYAASRAVLRLLRLRTIDTQLLREQLLGAAPASDLDWPDFAHLGGDRDVIERLLRGALAEKAEGVGLLFYGPPGTGKTEFARALAERVGARAVFIGEADESEGEPNRCERIAHFSMASRIASQTGGAVLVVDEADDVFTGVDSVNRASRAGSKVFINRMVERCAAPTIWITNHPESLGQATMRRMAFALRFPEPGRAVRRRMVERLCALRAVALDGGGLDRLAAIDAPPALIDAGLRAAKLGGGGAPDAERGVISLLTALERAPPACAPATIGFDPALSRADCDLAALADRAAAAFTRGERALSFCLHGLPGTGKSAYARFLAERFGLEVLHKRASDLLSMFVGGSEKAIAAAFVEASEREAMLVLDEVDSLLLDRAGAHRSWEVTQVNEMLTWMERHPLPFACTTNAMDSLDVATLRRFVFKIEFLDMTAEQARAAFRRCFDVCPPAALDALDMLTPGDFEVAARKARVLGERDPAALVALLALERAAKPQAKHGRIGF